MGKNIFTVTFCVTNWFQIRSHFKRKKIINIKNYNIHTSVFHFIMVATWKVLVLNKFLNFAFVISLQKNTFIVHNM